MAHRFTWLTFVTVAFLTGCNAASTAALKSAPRSQYPDEDLREYAGWAAMTAEPIRVPAALFALCGTPPEEMQLGPHFTPAIKVYANPVAAAALRGGKVTHLPRGSALVKEKWLDPDKEPPTEYAAMVKREPGYDPEHGDWEYVFTLVTEPGRQIQRGRMATCIACHKNAAARDYVFGTYLTPPLYVFPESAPDRRHAMSR
jgi:hypothetical protein